MTKQYSVFSVPPYKLQEEVNRMFKLGYELVSTSQARPEFNFVLVFTREKTCVDFSYLGGDSGLYRQKECP